MKTLVTGSCGFVAKHLVKSLKEQWHWVGGIDCLDEQVHGETDCDVWATRQKFGQCDDSSRRRVGEMHPYHLQGIDTVYHLAAKVGVGQSMYQIKEYVDMNVADTAHLLELLKGSSVKRLIVASSMSVYGEGQRMGSNEDDAINPPNIYALTKYDQERMCLIMGQAYGIETVALRFFNIIGPGQSLNNPYTGVAAIFASALMNNQAPTIFEDGNQTRDFIHVSDIVQALLLAQTLPAGVYNVGRGIPVRLIQLAEMMADLMGKNIKPNITGLKRAGDIRHCVADISKISAFGFKPKMNLEDSVRDIVQWVATQKADCRVEKATKELRENGLLK